jgi:hypothetical protein
MFTGRCTRRQEACAAARAWVLALGMAACGEPTEPSRELRILYQGSLYSERRLEELGLTPHHFAVSSELSQQGIIAGFDSEAESTSYLSQARESALGGESLTPPCAVPSPSLYYSHVWIEGERLVLRPGEGVMRLSGPTGPNWDERIGSMQISSCPGFATVYEKQDFSGKTLTFGSRAQVGSLSEFKLYTTESWRNAISSIRSVAYFDFSASDTDSGQRNTTNATVLLHPGQVLQVGTCGVPDAFATGDTFLRLLDARGNEVAANDDACGGRSSLSYAVPPGGGGSHELRVGCFGEGECRGRLAYTFYWKSLGDAAGTGVFQGE